MFKKFWIVFAAIYLQFFVLYFEKVANEPTQRDYTNSLKNAAVIANSAVIVLFQMMEFRVKYLTAPYTLALAFNLLLFV